MAELHWLRPLWLLALVPAAGLWWWYAHASGARRPWDALVDPHLRPWVLVHAGPARGGLRAVLSGLGALLLILALAGPTWQELVRPVFRIEQAQVLLLDLSATMDRADVAPTRLGRAHFEVLDLLAALDEGHTALVAFGAEPFLVAPLTTDTATLAEQVPALTTDVLPLTGATRPALALAQAHGLLAQAGAVAGTVILITDAAADPTPALPAAQRLLADGHRLAVHAVLADAGPGAVAALAPWQALARAGGGELVIARPDDTDRDRLLPNPADAAPGAADAAAARPRHWRDDGPWLLLALLPLAALGGRRGWFGVLPLTLALLSLPAPAPVRAADPAPTAVAEQPASTPSRAPFTWADLWQRRDQQAWARLLAGEASAAGGRFSDVRWRAAADYQSGRYAEALALLAGQQGVAAHYNRGNTLARLGRWQAALTEYRAALALDPGHADARHNHDLLIGLLAPTAAQGPDASPQAPGASSQAPDASSQAPGASSQTPGASAPATGAGSQTPWVNAPAAGASSQTPGASAPAAGASSQVPGASSQTPGAGSQAPGASSQVPEASQPTSGARLGGAASALGAVTRVGASGRAGDPAGEPTRNSSEPDALLRQVNDDPGGLLRERFMLQYLRRHGQLD